MCSCLPILPAFYQHFFQTTSEPRSNLSSYHRLKALKTSASSTRRTKLSHNEDVLNQGAAQEEVLEPSNVAGGLSSSVQGGRDVAEEKGGSWDGGGILKTVDVEQTGLSVPERASFPRAHIGSTRLS